MSEPDEMQNNEEYMENNEEGQNDGMNQLIRQFQQFRNNFTGNPQQQVQQLLNSGRVTQEQYNNAVKMANRLQQLLK